MILAMFPSKDSNLTYAQNLNIESERTKSSLPAGKLALNITKKTRI